jgi:hypothetical protein
VEPAETLARLRKKEVRSDWTNLKDSRLWPELSKILSLSRSSGKHEKVLYGKIESQLLLVTFSIGSQFQ